MFTYGLGDTMVDVMATERAERQRARIEGRAAWRARGRTAREYHAARYVPPVIGALPFPSSCRFCRRGYHHHAHFRGCSSVPQWARRTV